MLCRPPALLSEPVCTPCLRRLLSPVVRRYATSAAGGRKSWDGQFFQGNPVLKDLRKYSSETWKATRKQSTTASIPTILAGKTTPRPSNISSSNPQIPKDATTIPPDASSLLTTLSSSLPRHSLRRTLAAYLSLSKPRLSFLIVLTTTAAYSMYPVLLSPSLSSTLPSLSTITLLFLTSGTFLTSASANALNMLLEPKYDAQMSRTRNRPLVRKLLTSRAALLFAIATGLLGTAGLYYGVNPTTATLAAANILLYAFIYTPMKRIHPLNTWIGAIVGAIPPLMGWTAAAGQVASSSGDWKELLLGPDARGGWALAALLFAWQIPHFAGLSFSIRHEYAAAGYRMLASSNPRLDALFSLACAVGMPVAVWELYSADVVDFWAVAAMGPANGWLIWRSWQFWKAQGAKSATNVAGKAARNLFWASVWYLPIVLLLGMVGKKGLGERVWGYVTGQGGELDDDEEEEWVVERH